MIYQTLQIARFNPLPFSVTIYFERQGIFKNAALCYNMNYAEAQAGEDNILKYQWETAPDIYIGDDLHRRFVLGVSGNHPLICFGVNPSTANHEYADKTLHMVEQIAKRNGFDSWIMFNVYPHRSTDPKCLPCSRDDDLHHENLRYIERYLRETDLTLWAAWGEPITERDYLIDCLYDIYGIANKYSCRFIAFGKEENGVIKSTTRHHHPRHPSRLPLSAKSVSFDVTHYWAE